MHLSSLVWLWLADSEAERDCEVHAGDNDFGGGAGLSEAFVVVLQVQTKMHTMSDCRSSERFTCHSLI